MRKGPEQEVENVVASGAPQLRSFRGDALAVGSMILGVLAVYCPLALFSGEQTLLGDDRKH